MQSVSTQKSRVQVCSRLYFPEVSNKGVSLFFRETSTLQVSWLILYPHSPMVQKCCLKKHNQFLWTPGAGLLSVHGHEWHRDSHQDTDDKLLYLWPPWAALVSAGIQFFSEVIAFASSSHQPPMPSSPMLPQPVFYFLWGAATLFANATIVS